MQVFIYMSNFAKCVKRVGEVWLSMAKDTYVEDGRKMKTVANDGAVGTIELNKPRMDSETGAIYSENDLGQAKFDVNVEVGPSSTTKRQATVRSLTGMMTLTQDPETLQVLTAMAMMNMEGEGIGDVRDFFRQKLLRMGAVKPTEDEAKQLQAESQSQQPDANSVYLQAAAEKQKADALKSAAETQLTAAKIANTEADTATKLAGIQQDRLNAALQLEQALEQRLAPAQQQMSQQ
jgi:hypothetical protein